MSLWEALRQSPISIAEIDLEGFHYEVYRPHNGRLFLTWEFNRFFWSEPYVKDDTQLHMFYPWLFLSNDWQPVGIRSRIEVDTGH